MDFLDTVEFFHRDLAWAMSSNVHLPECVKLVRKGSWSKRGWVVLSYTHSSVRGRAVDFDSIRQAGSGPMPKEPYSEQIHFYSLSHHALWPLSVKPDASNQKKKVSPGNLHKALEI